ncbi:MAG: hypothetical protein HYU97_07175 [Deltaproteobacteria bacterium]|nr:hypothetical protein [Deltaproteobacteria bacterium]
MPDKPTHASYKVCNDNIFGLFGLISHCGTEQEGTLQEAQRAKRKFQNENANNYVIYCEMIDGYRPNCRKI